TTTFLVAYLYSGMSHTLGGLLPGVRKMGWAAFGMLIIGVILTSTPIVMAEASVLFTFYPRIQASTWFYLGLVLYVLGIWVAAFGVIINVAKLRKRHRRQHVPLFSYLAVGIFVLLLFGRLGVTYEVLSLIPWAFGRMEKIKVMP